MHERTLMTSLSIDQYQHLIWSQSANHGRPNRVGAVRDGRTWKVEGRGDGFNELRGLGVTARGDLAACDDVHRDSFLVISAGDT
jgi:hypothetical protein